MSSAYAAYPFSEDAAALASRLGVSRASVDLIRSSDFIDLHLEPFLWQRMLGIDMLARHYAWPAAGRWFGQTDLPRLLDAGLTGGMWSITTNPARSSEGRSRTFFRNLERLRAIFARVQDRVSVVRTRKEYDEARREGKHGAWIVIQGGNALDRSLDDLDRIPDSLIVRVTLVHLSSSSLGVTSSPLSPLARLSPAGRRRRGRGLTDFGRDYVRKLNEKRILVDLAHINREGFFDAVEVHDKTQPLVITHTGVNGAFPSWRNVDDDQLRAIAETGGTVGVIYHNMFLGPSLVHGKVSWIVDHLEHIVKVVGEDHASLGSDWDGLIVPPTDMPTCSEFPRLVEAMLRRGWKEERIRKILGQNFLRVIGDLRPE